jgi:hypothetical protein
MPRCAGGAYEIIKGKGATWFGVGAGLARSACREAHDEEQTALIARHAAIAAAIASPSLKTIGNVI